MTDGKIDLKRVIRTEPVGSDESDTDALADDIHGPLVFYHISAAVFLLILSLYTIAHPAEAFTLAYEWFFWIENHVRIIFGVDGEPVISTYVSPEDVYPVPETDLQIVIIATAILSMSIALGTIPLWVLICLVIRHKNETNDGRIL